MAKIYIKPRGFGEPILHREVKGVEWSWELIPFLRDIDHKRYAVKVPDFDEMCDEYCPCCDTEVVIPSFGISFCPNCGERILPCSMCNSDYNDCRLCPYERTESAVDFSKVDWESALVEEMCEAIEKHARDNGFSLDKPND